MRYWYRGRSPHGERGLKYHRSAALPAQSTRRSPHGERGLKSAVGGVDLAAVASLPTRGAWIEIPRILCPASCGCGRSPHGERGLKFVGVSLGEVAKRRSPHGERGLKSSDGHQGVGGERRSPHGERGLKSLSHCRPLVLFSRSPHGERGLKLAGAETDYLCR